MLVWVQLTRKCDRAHFLSLSLAPPFRGFRHADQPTRLALGLSPFPRHQEWQNGRAPTFDPRASGAECSHDLETHARCRRVCEFVTRVVWCVRIAADGSGVPIPLGCVVINHRLFTTGVTSSILLGRE